VALQCRRHATVLHTIHAPSSSPVVMSSDIVALPAIDAEALKQRLDALIASTSSPSVLMPSDIVALPAADAEILQQRLDAPAAATEAAEEKAAAVRRRVLAAVSSLIRSRPPPRNWSSDPRLTQPRRPRPPLRRTSTPSSPTSTSRRIP
jgi:hypothetical protein